MAEGKTKTKTEAAMESKFRRIPTGNGEFWPTQNATSGDTLTGKYIGSRPVDGRDGPYPAWEVLSGGNLHLVTGAALKSAFAQVRVGTEVQIVYLGVRRLDRGRTVKEFEFYAAVDSDELPF